MRARARLGVTKPRHAFATARETQARGADEEVIHASFGRHYVSVSSSCSSVLRQLARNIEPMISLDPIGERAGSFRVVEADGFLMVEEGAAPATRWGDLPSAVRGLHHALIKCFIDARPDLIWIHAGVVAFAGRALMLVGPAGQGKSTLVGELLEWGCDYLSDEVAPIDPVTDTVIPFPVSPWKRIPTLDRVPAERLHEIPKVCVRLAPTAVSAGAVALGQILFLRHLPDASGTAQLPCSRGTAVLELSRNSFNSQDSRTVELSRLCAMLDRIDAFYLEYAQANNAARHLIQTASFA